MSNQMYILIFIFAGLFWAGLMALGVVLLVGIARIKEPKPTAWEAEWAEIERNLNH